ncbi:MAG TPA: tetratricopeptide repeat protein [Candidatus Binatia bacterium]|nr:tetratricopeptide repeat protein [Candidatus Binatia bacterium]
MQPGETVWAVARAHRAEYPQASLDRIVRAIVAANPSAFPNGPGPIRRGARLQLPDAASLGGGAGTPAAGTAPVPVAEAEPATAPAEPPVPATSAGAAPAAPDAPAAPSASAAAAAPAASPAPASPPAASSTPATPSVLGVELLPALGREQRQGFAVVGNGFADGATLEFEDLAAHRRVAGRKPTSVTPQRIEYEARFGAEVSRWRVAVRNPDGSSSEPFEFDGGRDVMLALPPPVAEAVMPPVEPAKPAAPPAFATTAEAAAASRLLASRDGAALLALLAPMEEQYAGDPDYDYLLGVAQLDTGHPSEAIFALQRTLELRPGFSGARMELARAYYEVGDNEESRREFQTVREQDPPPAARDAIERYMSAVDLRSARYRALGRGQLETFGGYDTNANGGTDAQTIAFGPFLLNPAPNSRRQESPYYGVAGQYFYGAPLTPDWRWQAGARGTLRENPQASFVDASQALALASVTYGQRATVSAGLSGAWSTLADRANNHSYGLDVGSTLPLGEQFYGAASAHGGMLRYDAPSLKAQDVNQLVGAAALGWHVPWARRLDLDLGPLGGRDEAVNAGSTFGRDLLGARLNLFWVAPLRLVVSGSAAWVRSDYDYTRTALLAARSDEQAALQLTVDPSDWLRPWRLRLQGTWIDNRSSLALFQYDKTDIALYLGRDF